VNRGADGQRVAPELTIAGQCPPAGIQESANRDIPIRNSAEECLDVRRGQNEMVKRDKGLKISSADADTGDWFNCTGRSKNDAIGFFPDRSRSLRDQNVILAGGGSGN